MKDLSTDEVCFLLCLSESNSFTPDMHWLTEELARVLVCSPDLRSRWYKREFGYQVRASSVHADRFPLIGRGALVQELVLELQVPGQHVCLSGRGGVGKSRIAREVAQILKSTMDYRWQIKATDIVTRDTLKASLLLTVGLPGWGELVDRMVSEPALVILDDLNPLKELIEEIECIANDLPRMRFLITSRKDISTTHVKTWRIGPLSYSSRRELIKVATPLGVTPVFAGRLSGLPLALILGASMASAHTSGSSVYATSPVSMTSVRSIVQTMKRDALLDLAYLTTFAGTFSREDAVSILRLAGRPEDNIDALEQALHLTVDQPNSFCVHDEVRLRVIEQLRKDGRTVLDHANQCHAFLFKDRAQKIGILFRNGEWDAATALFETARVDCEKAAEWSKMKGDDQLSCDLAEGISIPLFESGFLSSFDRISAMGMASAKRLKNTTVELHLLGMRGAYFGRLGKSELAQNLWRQRNQRAADSKNWRVVVDSLADLALEDWSTGNLQEAHKKVDEMEHILSTENAVTLVDYRAVAHVIRSFVLDGEGLPDQSREQLSKAIEKVSYCQERNIVDFLTACIARQLLKWQEFDEALTYVRAHLKHSLSGHLVISCSMAMRDLAVILERQGKLNEAAPLLVGAVLCLNEFRSHHLSEANRALTAFELRHGASVSNAIASSYDKSWQTIASEAIRDFTPGQE